MGVCVCERERERGGGGGGTERERESEFALSPDCLLLFEGDVGLRERVSDINFPGCGYSQRESGSSRDWWIS